MATEKEKIWLVCPNNVCSEGFVHFIDESGKRALGLVGAAAGAALGTKVGIGGALAGAAMGTKAGAILGPMGLAVGLVGGGILGLVTGKEFGKKFDRPQCPKCGVKFDINAGFPKNLT
jgi:hypothetical protein